MDVPTVNNTSKLLRIIDHSLAYEPIDDRTRSELQLAYGLIARAITMANTIEVDPDELLTKKEAAALLKVTTITIDNFARRRRIKRYYVGKSVRFKRSEVAALAIESR